MPLTTVLHRSSADLKSWPGPQAPLLLCLERDKTAAGAAAHCSHPARIRASRLPAAIPRPIRAAPMPRSTLATAVLGLLRSAQAVTLPLHSAPWAGFKPAVELNGEFGNEGGSPLDLGGVFAVVSVGNQEFHVHVDTGSSMLIIPAASSQCPTCPPTQRAVGAPALSANARPPAVSPNPEGSKTVASCYCVASGRAIPRQVQRAWCRATPTSATFCRQTRTPETCLRSV
jgi:hypothetical protein